MIKKTLLAAAIVAIAGCDGANYTFEDDLIAWEPVKNPPTDINIPKNIPVNDSDYWKDNGELCGGVIYKYNVIPERVQETTKLIDGELSAEYSIIPNYTFAHLYRDTGGDLSKQTIGAIQTSNSFMAVNSPRTNIKCTQHSFSSGRNVPQNPMGRKIESVETGIVSMKIHNHSWTMMTRKISLTYVLMDSYESKPAQYILVLNDMGGNPLGTVDVKNSEDFYSAKIGSEFVYFRGID